MSTPPFIDPQAYRARKVAIPRLPRPEQSPQAFKERRRVPRACTACRVHKIKCTGDTPQCKHCTTTGRECIYILPRKDRLKSVTDRCVQLAALLQDLKDRVGDDDGARISDLLEATEEDVADVRQHTASSNPDTDQDEPRSAVDGVSLEVTETEPLDLLDENLERDERTQATGFVGKTSEVQWLRAVMAHLGRQETAFTGYRPPGSVTENVSSFSFYLDSDSIALDFVDPYALPTPEIALQLLTCYERTIHSTFPILSTKALDNFGQCLNIMRDSGQAPHLTLKWQGILNLVFALGARYSHLVQATWRAEIGDHLVYHARACVFGLHDLKTHPSVVDVQGVGLLALYYLAIGHISRASVIIGVGLRFAYAVGLHVRNDDPSASPTNKETRVRIWWSIYTLERLLGIITGRPGTIIDGCCSVPLPLPLAENQLSDDASEMDRFRKTHSRTPIMDSPVSQVSPGGFGLTDTPGTSTQAVVGIDASSGAYFKAVVQLSIITQNIFTSLYAAGNSMHSTNELQQYMTRLGQRLNQWAASLPAELNFQIQHTTPQWHRSERLLLAFQFQSSRILLARPCLGGFGHAVDQNLNDDFVRQMANECVDAARAMTDLLPDQPYARAVAFYDQGPWWCIVHYLMQSVSVFLLALVFSTRSPSDTTVISIYVKKLIIWLRAMQDPLAERAHQMALNTFQAVARRLTIDTSDLWMDYPLTSGESNLQEHTYPASFMLGVDPSLQGQYLPVSGDSGSAFTTMDPRMMLSLLPSNDGRGSTFSNPR